MKQIANEIGEDIRADLQENIMGWEDGVTKDEFLSALNFGIDKWTLVCLFHVTFDVEDGIDEIV